MGVVSPRRRIPKQQVRASSVSYRSAARSSCPLSPRRLIGLREPTTPGSSRLVCVATTSRSTRWCLCGNLDGTLRHGPVSTAMVPGQCARRRPSYHQLSRMLSRYDVWNPIASLQVCEALLAAAARIPRPRSLLRERENAREL